MNVLWTKSQVVELIVAANRSTTHVAYDSALRNWTDWCLARKADTLSNALMPVLRVFSPPASVDPLEHAKIGIHPLVIKLLKGCYNQNPPNPRYSSWWAQKWS
ncbi:hypothetical protein OUZ56_017497 [Daphnia magna]|uniref:Uncharacterized protein n=1 Tax=Daphnia magna TaxID=35525 RepID=A0ABR0ASX8_9CRUS|nr:hypothetical protein OUZ56_017497 [Daphnia magna]